MTIADLGDIGSLIAGVAGLLTVLAAVIIGSPGVREWQRKLVQDRLLAAENTRDLLLERRRLLHGWMLAAGIHTYGVELVIDSVEIEQAKEQLIAGGPSEFVLIRINETGDNANRAHSLRQLITREGHISRPPTKGEREALEKGAASLVESTPDDWRSGHSDYWDAS